MIMHKDIIDIEFGWQPSFAAELKACREGTKRFWKELHQMLINHEHERKAA